MSEYWTEKDVMENAILDLQHENDDLRTRIGELEQAHRWIPVSERLPEANNHYLTFDIDGDMEVASLHRHYDGKLKWEFTNDLSMGEYLTHWMPLPPPPPELE